VDPNTSPTPEAAMSVAARATDVSGELGFLLGAPSGGATRNSMPAAQSCFRSWHPAVTLLSSQGFCQWGFVSNRRAPA
jgi:hypothetical protein